MPDKTLTQDLFERYSTAFPKAVSSYENFQTGMNSDSVKREAVYNYFRNTGYLDDTWNFDDFTSVLAEDYKPIQQQREAIKKEEAAKAQEKIQSNENFPQQTYPEKEEYVTMLPGQKEELEDTFSFKDWAKQNAQETYDKTFGDRRNEPAAQMERWEQGRQERLLNEELKAKKEQYFKDNDIPLKEDGSIDYKNLHDAITAELKEKRPINFKTTSFVEGAGPQVEESVKTPEIRQLEFIERMSRHAIEDEKALQGEKEGWTTGFKRQMNFIDKVYSLADMLMLSDIAKKKSEGQELTKPEEISLAIFSDSSALQAKAMEEVKGYSKGSAIGGALSFLLEMTVTNPIAAPVKGALKGVTGAVTKEAEKIAQRSAKRLIQRTAKDQIKAVIRELPSTLGGEMARVPFMLSTQEQAGANLLGLYDLGVGFDESDNYSTQSVRNDKSVAGAVVKPVVGTAMMNTTFSLFGGLTPVVMQTAGKTLQGTKILGNLLKKTSKLTDNPFYAKSMEVLKPTGVAGIPLAGVQMPAADFVAGLSTGDWDRIKHIGTKEYWGDITAVSLFFGAIHAATGLTTGQMYKRTAVLEEAYNNNLKVFSNTFFAEPRLQGYQKRISKALNERAFFDKNGSAQGEVAKILKEMGETLRGSDMTKEAFSETMIFTDMVADLLAQGVYTFGNMKAMEARLVEEIGEFENKTADGRFVTIVKSGDNGNLYFLLDNKGDISILKGMTIEEKPFDAKTTSYDVLSSVPMEKFVGDVALLGKEGTMIREAEKGRNDAVIRDYNKENIERAEPQEAETQRAKAETQRPFEEQTEQKASEPKVETEPIQEEGVETAAEVSTPETPMEVRKPQILDRVIEQAREELKPGREIELEGKKYEIDEISEDGLVSLIDADGIEHLRPLEEIIEEKYPEQVEMASREESVAMEQTSPEVVEQPLQPQEKIVEQQPIESQPQEVEAPEVNYTEKLQVNPQEAYADIVKALGGDEQAAQSIVLEQRDAVQGELEKMAKKREKTTDLNERIKLAQQMSEKEAELERYNELLNPKEESQSVEQVAPVESPTKVEQRTYLLSNEIDDMGNQFVLSPEGNIEFGMIAEDTGLTPAPILLSEGMITDPATSAGYGLVHIEARHGEEIRKAGYKNVVDFVADVAQHYDKIKIGNDRDGKNTYLLQLTDKNNNTLIVELSQDGNYWNINTAGIFRSTYAKNKKEIYNRHATTKQPVEIAEGSPEVAQSNTPSSASTKPSKSPLAVSNDKDNTTPTQKQISEEDISEIIQPKRKTTLKEKVKEGIKKNELVAKRKKSLEKSFSLYNYTGNGVLQPIFGGVYYDPTGWAVATNAHLLIASKKLYDKKYKGLIVDKKGNTIERKYPDWEGLSWWQKEGTPIRTNYSELYDGFNRIEELIKEYNKLGKETKAVKPIKSDWSNVTIVLGTEENPIAFHGGMFKKFIDAAIHFNIKPSDLNLTDKAIKFQEQNEKGILLAKILDLDKSWWGKEEQIVWDARDGELYASTILQQIEIMKEDISGKENNRERQIAEAMERQTEDASVSEEIPPVEETTPTQSIPPMNKRVSDRKAYLSHRIDLEDFVSYNNPILEEAGIYQDPSGWAVVQNGGFTIATKPYFRPSLEGAVVGRSGPLEVEPKRITLWQEPFTKSDALPKTELNYNNIYDGIEEVNKAVSELSKKAKTDKFKAKQSGFEARTDKYVVIDNNGDAQMFNLSDLKLFADAALRFDKEGDIRTYMDARNHPVLEINTPEMKARVVGLSDAEATQKQGFDNAITVDARNGCLSISSNLESMIGKRAAKELAKPKFQRDSNLEDVLPQTLMDEQVEREIVNVLTDNLNEMGIPVITDEMEGQHLIDIYKGLEGQESLKMQIETKHGSGAPFDMFDHSYMSTGEGAQAYGWGTYLAGGPNGERIARGYATQIARNKKPNNLYYSDIIDRHLASLKGNSNYVSSEEFRAYTKQLEHELMDWYGETDAKALRNIALLEQTIDSVFNGNYEEVWYLTKLWDEIVDGNPYRMANEIYATGLFDTDIRTKLEDIAKTLDDFLTDVKLNSYKDLTKETLEKVATDIENTYGIDGGDALESLVYSIEERHTPDRYLYTVGIPDDNGRNYLYWEKEIPSWLTFDMVQDALRSKGIEIKQIEEFEKAKGSQLYTTLCKIFSRKSAEVMSGKESAEKMASLLLSDMGFVGITMPQGFRSGLWNTEERNYVIFKESDAKILNRIKFYKDKDGKTVLGLTYNGRVYFNPKSVKADTPIHEFTHLWSGVMQEGNPTEWKNIVSILKNECGDLWKEVKKLYPELDTDSELAEEVLAHYSGWRGRERFAKEVNRIKEDKSLSGSAKIIALKALNRLKAILNKFWRWVGEDLLHIHFKNAEEVADRVLYDMLNKTDLNKVREGVLKNSTPYKRAQFEKIHKANPMMGAEHTGIRNADEIKTFSEALQADKYDGTGYAPDFTNSDVQNVLQSGLVTVYSSNPIKTGVFVSPSRMEAEGYSANGKVYSKEVPVNEVAWIDGMQGQYSGKVEEKDSGIEKIKEVILNEFHKAQNGKAEGKRIEIGNLTSEGRSYLESISGIKIRPNVQFIINPSELKHIYNKHYGKNERDLSNNIPLTDEDIVAIADVITQPESVVYYIDKDNRKSFYFLKSSDKGAYNLLEIYTDRRGNLSTKTFYNTKKGVDRRLVELEKTPHISNSGTPLSTAKIPKLFEINKSSIIEDDSSIRFQRSPMEQVMENATERVNDEIAEAKEARREKIVAADESIRWLFKNKIQSAQRQYDRQTVNSVVSLANDLIKDNILLPEGKAEIKRLLGLANKATGKEDLNKVVNNLMGLMVDNQLKRSEEFFKRILKERGSKVNPSGVVVQGQLDVHSNRRLHTMKESMDMSISDIDALINNKMDAITDSQSKGEVYKVQQLQDEVDGLFMVREYVETVKQDLIDEKIMKEEFKQKRQEMLSAKEEGKITMKQYREFLAEYKDTLLSQKVKRLNQLAKMNKMLSDEVAKGREQARAFAQSVRERREQVQHIANSDLEGVPTGVQHRQRTRFAKFGNNAYQFFTAPFQSLEMLCKLFARNHPTGEGGIYNIVVRGAIDASGKEWTYYQDAINRIDTKLTEIFGKKTHWSDLESLDKLDNGIEITFIDGGKERTEVLAPSQMLYVYIVDKMQDGRMTLRSMGITAEDVERISQALDTRLVTFADWAQSELLPSLRDRYNERYEEMFGASMDNIEDYFPLKRLNYKEDTDVSQGANTSNSKPSTIANALKRRTPNLRPLDILGVNAFNVLTEHIQTMEHWYAYAPLIRDMNTLLSYNTFKNKVKNMTSVIGTGDVMWKAFEDCCRITVGSYQTKDNKINNLAVSISKGVTMSKINFRIFTAIKQTLSAPAALTNIGVRELKDSIRHPMTTVNWCYDNFPTLQKRWKSRRIGDIRLEVDKGFWNTGFAKWCEKYGMTPNAAVDFFTIAMISKAAYDTRLKTYINNGVREDLAMRMARQDAEIMYNSTQQSSEGAFLAPIQRDKDWLSVSFTTYRQASIGYQRRTLFAATKLYQLAAGSKEEFFTQAKKVYMRDFEMGEQEAENFAKRTYRHAYAKHAVDLAVFGYGLQFLWRLTTTGVAIAMLGSKDEREKVLQEANDYALTTGMLQGTTIGPMVENVVRQIQTGQTMGKALANGVFVGLPIATDIGTIFKTMEYDKAQAYQQIFNLATSALSGINPQVVADAVIAVDDICGDDDLAQEVWLAIMRTLQYPQSHTREYYIKEIAMTAEEALDLSIEEFAQRYAEYQVNRNAYTTAWVYTPEEREKRVNYYKKKFYGEMDKVRKSRSSEEEAIYDYLNDSLKEHKTTLRQLRSAAQRGERVKEYKEFVSSPDFKKNQKIQGLSKRLNDLMKEWNTVTGERKAKLKEEIEEVKQQLNETIKE